MEPEQEMLLLQSFSFIGNLLTYWIRFANAYVVWKYQRDHIAAHPRSMSSWKHAGNSNQHSVEVAYK